MQILYCLGGPHDAQNGMLEGQAALQINIVWRSQRAIGTQLNGSPLHEGACRHDNLVGIAHGSGAAKESTGEYF